MDCNETRNWLHGYLDGELDLPRTVEIEQHIEKCATCTQARDRHRALQELLRGASLQYPCPDHLRSKIQTTVVRKPLSGAARPDIRYRSLAITATLLLMVGGLWFAIRPVYGPSLNNRLAQDIVASHVRSLLADHLTDVASTDRHTVKPWFAGKLDFAPTVLDLSSEGFPLVGGRLDYLENRAVAAVIYKRRKHTINLFIWPSEDVPAKALQLTTAQGYQIAHWNEAGTAYWAISDLNANELGQFVHLIRSPRHGGTGNDKSADAALD
ncbi:MAG: putative anti-sigma factor [Planctomycetaceae bacterium]|nr:putative anti-sigma factor [Planctomycetaceae bacterium]